jgi:RNA polymerase sigma factor (sigma-70 family)
VSTRGSTPCGTTTRYARGSHSSRGGAASTRTDLTEVEEAFVVREALAGLSPTCQDMLDRFFARDQSYKTIADELAIPSGTIASRIARCLARLKQALEPES